MDRLTPLSTALSLKRYSRVCFKDINLGKHTEPNIWIHEKWQLKRCRIVWFNSITWSDLVRTTMTIKIYVNTKRKTDRDPGLSCLQRRQHNTHVTCRYCNHNYKFDNTQDHWGMNFIGRRRMGVNKVQRIDGILFI